MQNIEIFIINLARSVDRRESMKQKIAKIQGFGEIYIDGEKVSNSSLGSHCVDLQNFGTSQTPSLVSAPKFCKNSTSTTAIRRICEQSETTNTSIVLNASESSLRENERSEFSWQSKPRESNKNSESMTEKRINESDSNLKHFDSYNLDSQVLDSSLNSRFAQNDESSVDCFGDKSPRNDGNNALTLHFHFFPATDANDFKDNPTKIPPHYRPKLTRFVKGKDLSFGEIACFSSHYRLWQKCVELDSPIIVLEDDIDFIQDFCQIIEIFKSPFEYVRLYYLFDRKITHLYDNFYISFDRTAGTQGYYLTPQAAQKFIKNARFWLFCVDDYMDMFFIHNVKNIIFLPFVITEDSANATQSTILGRTKPKMSFGRKLTRELSRIYFYVIRKGLYMLVFYAYGRRIYPHSSLRGKSQDLPKQSTNQKNGLPRKSCGFSRNDGEV